MFLYFLYFYSPTINNKLTEPCFGTLKLHLRLTVVVVVVMVKSVIGAIATVSERGAEVRCGRFRFETSPSPALGGVGGEEVPTPPQLLVSALAACLTEMFKMVSEEKGVKLEGLRVIAEASIDPEGVKGVEGHDAALRDFSVKIRVKGASQEVAEEIIREVERRCPVGLALSRANQIKVEVKTGK